MRIMTAVFVMLAFFFIVSTNAVQHNEALVHDTTSLQSETLSNAVPSALADFKKTLLAELIAGTGTVSSPPTSLSNTLVPCPASTLNQYCAGTIRYTATLASNDITNHSTAAVLSPTVRDHLNDNHGTDPNGNPVYNATTYRIHIGLEYANKEVVAQNLDAETNIYDSYPITISINTVRTDSIAQSSNSVGYADSYCGETTIGCTTVNTAADTTVPQAQTTCYDANAAADPTLENRCSPVGDPTATPHPHNSFENNATQADGTNSSSASAP
jgi:hypothetical protein